MPLTLTRKPRSANAAKAIVKSEVRAAWKQAGDKAITTLQEDVANWQDKPEFKVLVTIGAKQWTFKVKYDGKTDAGKHYKWVDEGTAERGGKGSAYPIVAKNTRYLHYMIPQFPKTLPGDGGRPITGLNINASSIQEDVFRRKVMHPGITPRKFTDSLRDQMKQPGAGNFKNLTDAAIKRALRKIGKPR